MRTFQDNVFIQTQTYREIFKSELIEKSRIKMSQSS